MRKKKGFSLIELSIVLAIIAILTTAVAPTMIKKIQIKAGEKTALEMAVIQEAARAYYLNHDAWPPNIQTLKDQNYLNSSWVANNPWNNPYELNSSLMRLTISSSVPDEWTKLVARDLPSTTINGTVVSSTIPIPGFATESLPTGAIIIWGGEACPNGYTRVAELDGKFIVGGSSYVAAAGGSNQHTHTAGEFKVLSHNHRSQIGGSPQSIWIDDNSGGDDYWGSPAGHTHTINIEPSGDLPVTGTSAAADSRPEFATVLLCKKNPLPE